MAQTMAQPRLPQPHEYQQLGAYMRDLRLYYGLDTNEVAQRIHVRAKYVQAIEEGRLEQMPGKVYARGYIVTYAEFLGLDGEAIADQLLDVKAAPPKEQVYFVPEPKRARAKTQAKMGAWVYIVAAAVIGVLVLVFLPRGESSVTEEETTSISDVPERLMNSMRNGIMPIARNYDCLMGTDLLACSEVEESVTVPFAAQLPVQWPDAARAPKEEVIVEEDAPVEEEAVVDEPAAPAPVAEEPEKVEAPAKPKPKPVQKKREEPKPLPELDEPDPVPELTPDAVIPEEKASEPAKSMWDEFEFPDLPAVDPNTSEESFPRRHRR